MKLDSIIDFIETRKNCVTAQKMKFSIKDFFSKCDQIFDYIYRRNL